MGKFVPQKNLVYITVSLTVSSSALLTLEYLDEVYFPEVGLDAYGAFLTGQIGRASCQECIWHS